MTEYPLSTSIHLTWDPSFRTSMDSQIGRIAGAGFRRLDFNFLDYCNSPDSPFTSEGWEGWIDSAGEAADRYGAKFNQAHAPCPVLSCAEDMTLMKKLCRRAFIGCAKLGIPWLVFHHIPDPAKYGSGLTKFEFDRLFFSWMLEDAHRYGVGIAIENLFNGGEAGGVRLNPVDYSIALADELCDPLVGVCYDTGHGNIKRYNLLGGEKDTTDAYANIIRIGKRLRATHIHDNTGDIDEHIPPFMGTIDWKGVMRALDEIGYEQSFTFEAHNSVYRIRTAGLDDSIIDSSIALLWQIGDAIIHIER